MILNRTRLAGHIWLVALLLCVVAAFASTAKADWIAGFPPEPGVGETHDNPDMTHWFLTVSYDGAGNLSVNSQYPGIAVLNDGAYDIGPDSTLSINMVLNPSNGAPISGSLLITGDAPDYAASPAGVLLTGSIAQFGFSPTPQNPANFQFLFNTTGGQLASVYPSIAINLTFAQISYTNWNTSFFDDSGSAQTDTFAGPQLTPVPEPTSLSLLCFGALAVSTGLGVLRGARVLRGSPKE